MESNHVHATGDSGRSIGSTDRDRLNLEPVATGSNSDDRSDIGDNGSEQANQQGRQLMRTAPCSSPNGDHGCNGIVTTFKAGHYGDNRYRYQDEHYTCEVCNHQQQETEDDK